MRTALLIVAGLLLVAWLTTAIYTVDRAEYVYVTEFGKPVATFDGGPHLDAQQASVSDAGLRFKLPWPIQSVQRLDRRLQYFDLPGQEVVTPDTGGKTIEKTLTLGAYVCWRIAGKDEVDRFIRTVGTPERAQDYLGRDVISHLGAVITNVELSKWISPADDAEVARRMDALARQLIGDDSPNGLRALALSRYGIDLVDVRLQRFNHPVSVRSAIFDRIRSERSKKVGDYESEGKKLSDDIRSDAVRQVSDILTSARAEEQRERKEADIKADMIRNQAHSQDPEFYAFLQKLEAYQKILGQTKDVLLLSTRHELFDLLLKPPRSNGPRPLTSPPVAGTTTGNPTGDQP